MIDFDSSPQNPASCGFILSDWRFTCKKWEQEVLRRGGVAVQGFQYLRPATGQDQSLQHSGAQAVGGGQAVADLQGICPSVLLDARMKWRDICFSFFFDFVF